MSFADFVDWALNTVNRCTADPNAQDELFKLVVWEGLTKESKLSCAGNQNAEVEDWFFETQYIGASTHTSPVQVTTLA